ncbi:unnamed protein product [Notodromas monacha]|uniref:Uncharacterized protein n=1 Tax=Notodromas monacha TaxID=399045 RepID=A0A7R9BKC1_9CRUS|nr:unnamed protein product [Notodromas monacha]CAG0916238.1 unnamed protein product [Notodromas monacha]
MVSIVDRLCSVVMSVIIPSVTLRNGAKMPMIGLGTWLSNHVDVRSAVESALEAGYRHIDTAYA